MTREIYDNSHDLFLPNRKECYASKEVVKTITWKVSTCYGGISRYRSVLCCIASRLCGNSQASPLWISGLALIRPFLNSPQPDDRAPAMYAPEARSSLFHGLGWGAAGRENSVRVYRGASWVSAYQPLARLRAKPLQTTASDFPSLQNPASGFRDSRNSYRRKSLRRSSPISRVSRSGLVTNGCAANSIRHRASSSGYCTAIKAGASSNISCAAAKSRGGWTRCALGVARRLTSKSGSNSASICKEAA
jgi:hypothetical protein